MPDDDARVLFELFDESTGRGSAPAEPAAAVPVSKTFRAFAPEQDLLLPPSLDDWLGSSPSWLMSTWACPGSTPRTPRPRAPHPTTHG